MDGYQFIADLFKSLVSLAWPAAFVAAVWLFREKLMELMPLLRLKYKDLDVSFRLEQAEKEAAQLPALPEPPAPPTPEERSKFEQIAELSPRAAVLEVRNELEDAVIRAAEATVDTGGKRHDWPTMVRILRMGELLDPETAAILDDLRVVGNNAAHSSTENITKATALRYRTLADMVIPRLQNLAKPQ